jgi:PAS domain S-box-containing protein
MPPGTQDLPPRLPEDFGIGRLFAHTREAVIVAEVDSGRIVLWNPAAERLFGYSAAEAIGGLVEELIVPPSWRPAHRAGLARYQRSGHGLVIDASRPVEVTARTRMGAELAVELSLAPLEPTRDGHRFVLAVIRGVSEQRETRRALERQAELLDLAHDAIIVRDLRDGTIRFWNRGAEELYGWTRDEAVGQISSALLRTEFPQPVEMIESELRRTGRWEGELVHWGRTGERVVVASRWAVQRDERGEAIAFLEINTDITARKQAELALRAEQEFSRGLIDSATDGIMAFDAAYRYTIWNPAMERITGLPKDAVLGRCAFDIFPFLRAIRQDRYFAEALAGRTVVSTDRPYSVPETGRAGFFESQYTPIRDESGAIIGGLGLIRDITERKQAEAERAALAREHAARAEAEGALRERDQVLATVSHDLKAPLTTIQGQAQLLRRRAERTGTLELERVLKGLALIETAVTKMGGWIDELLDVARLEAGRPLELRPEPTDLVALAWQAAAEQQRTTERHRIRVECSERELVGVWDPARLGRVLDNLLSNAVKYSPAGGEVSVSLGREQQQSGESWAVVQVRDQGVGIPAADQPHIFERFRRGANVVGRIAGTGIGLAGAYQIVQQHGGTIEVSSQERQGSTFTVRLPLVPG